VNRLLLPTTDAGVAVQAAIAGVVLALALWRTWRQPELRLLVIGVAAVSFALMGLRAAH
jgi:hypothetical protein